MITFSSQKLLNYDRESYVSGREANGERQVEAEHHLVASLLQNMLNGSLFES